MRFMILLHKFSIQVAFVMLLANNALAFTTDNDTNYNIAVAECNLANANCKIAALKECDSINKILYPVAYLTCVYITEPQMYQTCADNLSACLASAKKYVLNNGAT